MSDSKIRFRAIKPKPFDSEAMTDVLREAMKEFMEEVVKEHDAVTGAWQGERPEWVGKYWANKYQIGFNVDVDDPESKGALKWLWLDKGTSGPYDIPKEGKTLLAFPSVYNAGSRPGSLDVGTSSSGGETVFAMHVTHPGIQPRDWSVRLAEKEREAFGKWMAPYMKEAAKASGHAV